MVNNIDKRALGDEWVGWNGKNDGSSTSGKSLYLAYAIFIFLLSDLIVLGGAYLITPRLAMWNGMLPLVAWLIAFMLVCLSSLWAIQLGLTAVFEHRFFIFGNNAKIAFAFTYGAAFRLARLMGIDKDRLGHSFVKVSNAMSKALYKKKNENLLMLLPRCLAKEQMEKINLLKKEYGFEVCIVGGGEQARKKIKDMKPTAVIGVACERDLVSGITDVASKKISIIGIPNKRPEGPCKNTVIDMNELRDAIEFYLETTSASQVGVQ